jgi:hypothetical protein
MAKAAIVPAIAPAAACLKVGFILACHIDAENRLSAL